MAQYSYGQLKEDYENFSNEFAIVRVNQKKISDSRQKFIVGDLAVELTCGFEASIATFSIYNCFDQEKGCFLVDELKKYIAMGSQVEISLGYAALVKPVFVGFIARTAFCYGRGELAHVSIMCMDAKGAMMAGCYCRQLISKYYSDAVNEILEKISYAKLQGTEIIKSLRVSRTPDKTTGNNDDVLSLEMTSESDYDFIVRAAKKFNYEFYIDCGELVFRRAMANAATIIELEAGNGIMNMEAAYDLTGVIESAIVRGVDADKGRVIEAEVKNTNKLSIGSYAKNIVKGKKSVNIDATVSSSDEAQYRAGYLMNHAAYSLGRLECETIGLPEIKPGNYITIKGFGKPAENTYYIIDVVHSLDQYSGYRTKITACTDSVEKELKNGFI